MVYLILYHIFAYIIGNEAIGMLFLDESIEASDQQRIVGKFLFETFVREMTTFAFHFSFICRVPCQILQGMAPDEQRCAKGFPFFSEKGSTVFMLVNLAVGNYVKPCLGLITSFSITLTSLLLLVFIRDKGLVILLLVFPGCMKNLI